MSSYLPSSKEKKRKFPRASCSWQGSIITSDKSVHSVIIKNVSIDGVMVMADTKLEKNQRVMLIFKALNGHKSLEIRQVSRVIHTILKGADFEVGLEFVKVQSKSSDFIKEYVNNRLMKK